MTIYSHHALTPASDHGGFIFPIAPLSFVLDTYLPRSFIYLEILRQPYSYARLNVHINVSLN